MTVCSRSHRRSVAALGGVAREEVLHVVGILFDLGADLLGEVGRAEVTR
jgi:hypothetical protein